MSTKKNANGKTIRDYNRCKGKVSKILSKLVGKKGMATLMGTIKEIEGKGDPVLGILCDPERKPKVGSELLNFRVPGMTSYFHSEPIQNPKESHGRAKRKSHLR